MAELAQEKSSSALWGEDTSRGGSSSQGAAKGTGGIDDLLF
jgi:hypothetical protein